MIRLEINNIFEVKKFMKQVELKERETGAHIVDEMIKIGLIPKENREYAIDKYLHERVVFNRLYDLI